MNEIRRVLRAAAWRIFVIDFVRWLVLAVCAMIGGMIVLRVGQKLTAMTVPWTQVAQWSAGGAVAVALIWSLITRSDRAAVARRVDEGADLREAISTALCVQGQTDPWSNLAVESAAARARTVNVRQAVPVTPPRFWPVPLALGLVLLIAWVMPDRDLFGKRAAAAEQQKKHESVVQVKHQVDLEVKKAMDAASTLDLGKDKEPQAPEAQKPEPKTPEEVKREAVKKLTSLKDKLEELKTGEKGSTLEAIKQELKQLKTPGDGPLTDLSLQLAKGDFQKASAELSKLLEKVQSGQLSDEQKAKLAEQLKQMQAQLEKLAADQKELEKALEKAGLDKKLGADPEALKKALEESKNLTDEQKKQLQKQAQAQSQACKACNSMSASMGKMCRNMGKDGMSQEGMEGAEGLAGQMSELEQMASEMAMADAAMSKCEGSLAALESFSECNNPGMGDCEGMIPGTAPFKSGWSEKMGAGRGGPGRSRGGGDPGETEAKYAAEKKKFETKNQGGPIISSRLVEGDSIKGESAEQFAAAAAAAQASATEAIENNVYPREYHDAIKHYFGRLNAKAKAEEVGGKPAAPAAPGKK